MQQISADAWVSGNKYLLMLEFQEAVWIQNCCFRRLWSHLLKNKIPYVVAVLERPEPKRIPDRENWAALCSSVWILWMLFCNCVHPLEADPVLFCCHADLKVHPWAMNNEVGYQWNKECAGPVFPHSIWVSLLLSLAIPEMTDNTSSQNTLYKV